MIDYLVVVGSVNAEQYQPARLDMLNLNLRPIVVRVTDGEFTVPFESLEDGYVEPCAIIHSKDGVELIRVPFEAVRGLVLPEEVWRHTDNMHDEHPDEFMNLVVRYIIRASGRAEKM